MSAKTSSRGSAPQRPAPLTWRPFQVAGIVLGAPLLGLSVVAVQFNRPPFHLGKLDRLTLGMSQDDVRQALGRPTGRYDGYWTYSRPMAWPIVYVYFDGRGKFIRHCYDF